ncbi:MAG TPA: SDR family NAD(P)-dependent oxidoreductase [Dehalococcoidales bacterium]|nr:SDR family NAD(P)-dependent oxidoreductase [Dehalococcoidales bacterium]
MGDILKGKVAVVTGSGQGIGRAIAIGLAREGARVVTNNRKPSSTGHQMLSEKQLAALDKKKRAAFEKATEDINGDAGTTAQTIRDEGGEAIACFGNITDFNFSEKLINTAVDKFGSIDILVNVAGGFGFSPLEKMTEELWDKVTLTKPKGYFNTIRHSVPFMIKQKWGRIINCTSRAFIGDVIKHAEYCTANAGVVGLTKAVAIEMRQHGITCNAFSPYAKTRADYELKTFTEISDFNLWINKGPRSSSGMVAPSPDYIAPFICYLASEAAAGISGSVFSLGGNNIGLYADPFIAHNMTKFGEKPWTVEEIMQQAPRALLTGYVNPAEHTYQ